MTNALGDRIREIRKRRGWTQPQLAEKAGVYTNGVPRLESGKNVSVSTLVDICWALGYCVELRIIPEVTPEVNFDDVIR